MRVFTEQQHGESLESFVDRVIKPTADEMRSLREDVDSFASFLKNGFSYKQYTVAEVLKSGSLGQGTATKGSDLDLVVYFNGVASIEELNQIRSKLLKEIKQQVAEYTDWRPAVVRLKRMKRYLVKYILTKGSGKDKITHRVDILPAFDVLKHISSDPATLYQKIGFTGLCPLTKGDRNRRNKKGRRYSVSLAPLQIAFLDDFFKGIGTQRSQEIREKVKDVIRLLKYWKKEKDLNISSYTLELLTVHAYRTTPWTSTTALFRAVLTLLTKCGRLCVAFDTNYQPKEYTSYRGPPYVLDPANPLMNTLSDVNCGAVQRAARATLLQ